MRPFKSLKMQEPTVNYGMFISGIINFIIMAFIVFIWLNGLIN